MTDIVCPDDSTTCLLRALLNDTTSKLILQQLIDANNQYDWNPVTLGFTVAIGVLAFIVAIVTVFQGCLAAGPGRLKAGHQAIGPWFLHSDVSFSWYQLAARSRARTPFIDMKAFETNDEPSATFKDGGKSRTAYQKLRNQILFGFEESQFASDVSPYNASWANLLRQACITDTYRFGDLKTWHTDYIEESLQAAPASGMMSSLVFLTTYVNDTSIIEIPEKDQGRLFSVRGLTSELISRDFENMGPVVSFVSFGLSAPLGATKNPSKLSKDEKNEMAGDLVASFALFNGRIPFGDTELRIGGKDKVFSETRRKLRGEISHMRTSDSFFSENECPLLLALCIGDVSYRPRAFPKRSSRLNDAIAALTKSTMWEFKIVRIWFASWVDFAKSVTHNKAEQRKAWRFPARMREAPFQKLEPLWQDLKVIHPFKNQQEQYLAEKLDKVRAQQHIPSWTATSSAPRLLMKWEGKVQIAAIVYALTRCIARSSKPEYDLNVDRDSTCKPILEELYHDRSATACHRILLQNEILCVDEWLRQREESEPHIVMCALMVLMKIVDTKNGGFPTPDKNNHLISRPSGPDVPWPVCLLSDADREKAMESAFVYVGGEKMYHDSTGEEEVDVDKALLSDADTDTENVSYNGRTRTDKTGSQSNFWNIVEVLRYRGLLYAAMLELCADSSDLLGRDYTDFAVKII